MLKKSYLIVKDNKLIEARYKLTLQEQKVVLALTSKITKGDDDLKTIVFSVKELANFLGIKKNGYYNELKKITESLITRVLKIKEPDGLLQISWLSSAKYYENEGKVELSFDPKLKPYLLQLKKNFTKYQLKNIVDLDSIYAIRIYELCKQYEKLEERSIEIKELREILQIKKTKYKLYGDFKKYVLETAKREINAKTDLEIDFGEIKTGRKVTSIKFKIKKEEIIEKSIEKDFEIISKEYIKEYSKEVLELFELLPLEEQLEDRKKELEKILKKHSYKMILGDINYCKNNAKDNFWGYFLKSLKSGHYGKVKVEKEKIKLEKNKKIYEEKIQKEQKSEDEKNKLLKEREKNSILDEKYNSYDEKTKELIRNTADDIVENEGITFPIKTIRESMFNTLYKYKAMEELMKYNLIK